MNIFCIEKHWYFLEHLHWDFVNGKTVTQKNVVAVLVNFNIMDVKDHNVLKGS